MEYLILGSIGIILVVLFFQQMKKRNTKKKLGEIRASWGKLKEENFPFEAIRTYADTVKGHPFHRLSEQTIDDIDLYGLFAFIDRTTSKVGQQFLFKKLIEPTSDTVNQSEDLVKLFTSDTQLREEIQLELIKLNDNGAYFIPTLLKDRLLEQPKWFKFLYWDIFLTLGLLILSFQFPILIVALLVPVALNIFLHYWNKSNTFQFLRSFPQLNRLINVSKDLLKKGTSFDDPTIGKSIASLKSFQQKVSFLNLENGGDVQSELSMLASYVSEMIKAVLLIEVFALYKITKELETKRVDIENLFNYVGNIDSVISIASLRAGEQKTCQPTLVSPAKELKAIGIYHPLIEDCVKNDLSIKDKSILITGSNMSGKSTFLRTLTLNSILAQTIHTCFADEFISPMLKQFSSIRIDDNLFDGKSYYFQEVNIMGSLLEQVRKSQQNLFVLDEVFKGTNTIERIAAAKAILSYLNQKDHMVLVSTHDIELADLLSQEYDLYHFTETVENNELHFDHRIKSGQLKTRNAIKILELSNYPKSIIQEAQELSKALGASKVVGKE